MSAKEQIPTLTNKRLKALAFNAWRSAASANKQRRQKAMRLRPLLRAELAAREARKASSA